MQLGNYIVHTAEASDVEILALAKNAQQALLQHRRLDLVDSVIYVFDSPFTEQDPETGQWFSGFKSGWKVDIRAS